MEPRTPRNAKIPPNKNSITNGQTAKSREAAVPPLAGFQWNSNFDAWWVLLGASWMHLGRLVGVLGHFLSTLDRFGLDLKRILSSFWEVWASKMTSWARIFFLLIPSHECS